MTETTGTFIALKIWLSICSISIFAYTGVNSEAFSVLGTLMLIDMITGISKQYVLDPQLVTSHRWWLGLIKKFLTLIGILSLGMAIRGAGFNPTVFLAVTIPGFIGAELYSVIQNIYIVNTGEKVTEFNASRYIFQALLRTIRGRIEVETEQVVSIYSKKSK